MNLFAGIETVTDPPPFVNVGKMVLALGGVLIKSFRKLETCSRWLWLLIAR
jgi:hypothetical protein